MSANTGYRPENLYEELETARQEITAAARHLQAAYEAMEPCTDRKSYNFHLAGIVIETRGMVIASCTTMYHMVSLLCAAGAIPIESELERYRAKEAGHQEPKAKDRTRAKSAKSKNATAKDAQGIAWPEIAEGVVQ